MSRKLEHVVVLGGSLTGLLAARALADAAERVTVVERGSLPDGPAPRREVPQAQHLHVVLRGGVEALDRLFPTLHADLEGGGAEAFDYGRGAAVGVGDRYLAGFDSDLWVQGCTRGLLEWTIARRVAEDPRIRFRTGTTATGLRFEGDRVAGLLLEDDDPLRADLVVDASGRASRVPRWLCDAGRSEVPEVLVDARLTYACRLYARPDGAPPPWRLLMSMPRPPGVSRSGGIYAVEGDRWQVTLGAMDGDALPAPTDDEGWLAFARSLPVAAVGEALAGARPLAPATHSRATADQIRRYDEMADLPDGLVCVGDAVCALNPLYGQGISLAALGVEALADALRTARTDRPEDPIGGLSKPFQARLARQNRPVAATAIGADAAWPHTRGLETLGRAGDFLRGPGGRWSRAYAERVLQLALDEPEVARAYMEVMHLVRPSGALMRPSLVWRALRHRPRAA